MNCSPPSATLKKTNNHMTEEEKQRQIDKAVAELEKIHAEYLERFADLKKQQMDLLKEVSERVEALEIGRLIKNIKKGSN
jgi:hypothetical protein